MLRPFSHSVTCCCLLLGVVALSFYTGQTLTQQLQAMLRLFARGFELPVQLTINDTINFVKINTKT